MASNIVFDSSVLIMLFAKEPGYEVVRQNMKHAIISAINIAEVYKYCIEVQNLSEDDCKDLIKLCGIKIIDFCEEQALISAKIVKNTKQYGLSLGDRGCIALAILKNCPILTYDKIWQKVNLNIEFIMAR
jgi:PIN domain nuclease of toxin-antitoxin system